MEDPRCLSGLAELLTRLRQGRLQLAQQPRVFRQSEEEIDAVALALVHQMVPTKTAVAPHQDRHPRPALPQPGDDARQVFEDAGRVVDVGRSQ